jgi:plastocyanin domain-containing protein
MSWLVNLGGITLIALIVWWFWGARLKGNRSRKSA